MCTKEWFPILFSYPLLASMIIGPGLSLSLCHARKKILKVLIQVSLFFEWTKGMRWTFHEFLVFIFCLNNFWPRDLSLLVLFLLGPLFLFIFIGLIIIDPGISPCNIQKNIHAQRRDFLVFLSSPNNIWRWLVLFGSLSRFIFLGLRNFDPGISLCRVQRNIHIPRCDFPVFPFEPQ